MQYRGTYALINLKNIKDNVKTIIKNYPKYRYYIGVVKADSYGHDGIEVVRSIIDGGCNYLAVATLDEALTIRKEIKDIPILCLGIVNIEYLSICLKENITITVNNLEYLKSITTVGLKIHIKLDTGMNRLGIKDKKELIDTYNLALSKGLFVEGIYSHLYQAESNINNEKQLQRFKQLLSNIDLSNIPIIHLQASEGIINLEKNVFINGCRLGIMMYGFTSNKSLNLKSTFSLYSEVIQINNLKPNDTLGYNGLYVASENTKVAVVAIGYADGIIRKNTGRDVYINNKKYKVIGNICMDMLFVKVDDDVKVGDKVEILRDNNHILEVSNYLETIPYEIICSISKRVPRIYK